VFVAICSNLATLELQSRRNSNILGTNTSSKTSTFEGNHRYLRQSGDLQASSATSKHHFCKRPSLFTSIWRPPSVKTAVIQSPIPKHSFCNTLEVQKHCSSGLGSAAVLRSSLNPTRCFSICHGVLNPKSEKASKSLEAKLLCRDLFTSILQTIKNIK
jgi:hypothetical protein